jgi:hypothetical protein
VDVTWGYTISVGTLVSNAGHPKEVLLVGIISVGPLETNGAGQQKEVGIIQSSTDSSVMTTTSERKLHE